MEAERDPKGATDGNIFLGGGLGCATFRCRFFPAPVPKPGVYIQVLDVAKHLSQPSLSPLHFSCNW
jgi:hypothetical protein